jgi:lysozyme
MLGLPTLLAWALYKRYGQTPPAQLNIDPSTGAVLPFDAATPTILQQFMTYVWNIEPSQGALDFIRQTESLSLTPYHGAADAPGVYTIGYGHKILPSDPYWPYGSIQAISQDEAEALFEADVGIAASAVRNMVQVALSQGQFDALVSFVFNLGGAKVASSTLIQKLNSGDYAGAAAEFTRWVYANGQIAAGLVTRRVAEQTTFATG